MLRQTETRRRVGFTKASVRCSRVDHDWREREVEGKPELRSGPIM